jgi:hypothetical protein
MFVCDCPAAGSDRQRVYPRGVPATCGTVVLVLARSRPEGSTLLTACASSLRRRADKAHCCTALIKSLRQLS